MKKYNQPKINIVALLSADVITASKVTASATGSGDDWDWSLSTVDIEDGM